MRFHYCETKTCKSYSLIATHFNFNVCCCCHWQHCDTLWLHKIYNFFLLLKIQAELWFGIQFAFIRYSMEPKQHNVQQWTLFTVDSFFTTRVFLFHSANISYQAMKFLNTLTRKNWQIHNWKNIFPHASL